MPRQKAKKIRVQNTYFIFYGCVGVFYLFVCSRYLVVFQNFLIAIIVGAILDFIIGTAIGPTDDLERAQGFSGFQRKYSSAIYYSGVYRNMFQMLLIQSKEDMMSCSLIHVFRFLNK